MENRASVLKYKVNDTFLLRSPFLPVQTLEHISQSADHEKLLKGQFSRKECREALYLASPGLFRQLTGWMKGDQTTEKVKRKLMQYLIRMSSRCTPFGGFAGICPGLFGKDDEVVLKGPGSHHLHFRPDMQFLCTLTDWMLSDRKYREILDYEVSTSLAEIGEEYHYTEHYIDQHGVRRYLLSSTLKTQALSAILKAATNETSFKSLVKMIHKNDIDETEATDYIHTLIDNQVLISNLEPTLSGQGYYDELHSILGMHPHKHPGARIFTTVRRSIDAMNDNKSPDRTGAIRSLFSEIQSSGLTLNERTFLQADMRMMTEKCMLSDEIKQDLVDAVNILAKFSRPEKNHLMERFKDRFTRRYGDQEIPLNLVMDAEAGPAYLPEDGRIENSPLTDGLEIPQKKSAVREIEWSETDAYLYRRHQEAMMEAEYQVELCDPDLDELPVPSHDLPKTISMLAQLLGSNKDKQSRRSIFIKNAGGNSAINLAGRFAYLTHELEECLKHMAHVEQHHYGDTVLAEIIHLPEERTGNVLLRPILRPYEIPYIARTAVDPEHCLRLSDIMVSVKSGEVFLRSRKLDRYIIPRLSNAHNYALGKLSVYRFLCDLQSQDVTTNLGFSWGPLEHEAYFLPRLYYRNIILRPAQWNISAKQLNVLKKARVASTFHDELKKLMNRFKIPREILLTDYDNELWLDLENKLCRDILFNDIKKKNMLSIREYLHPGKDALVKSPEGDHANEFLFFLYLSTE